MFIVRGFRNTRDTIRDNKKVTGAIAGGSVAVFGAIVTIPIIVPALGVGSGAAAITSGLAWMGGSMLGGVVVASGVTVVSTGIGAGTGAFIASKIGNNEPDNQTIEEIMERLMEELLENVEMIE